MKNKKILLFVFLGVVLFLGSFYGFSQYFSWFSQDGLVSYFRLGERQEVLNEIKRYRFDDVVDVNSWYLYQDVSTANISLDSSDYQIGSGSLKIEVTSSDLNPGRIQLLEDDFSIVSGRTYILSFYAKSSVSFSPNIEIKKDISPYSNYGLYKTETFSTSWQKYEYRFDANTTDSIARVNFLLGTASTGTSIWIDDVVLYEVNTGNEIGNNHAEVYGATYVDDQSGNSNGAMQFDGVNDYVRLDDSASDIAGSDFTMSAWIKGISQDRGCIISINTSSGGNRTLWFVRNAGIGIFDGVNWYIGNVNVGNNLWHHVVITYKKGVKEAKLYTDGVLDSSFITGTDINIATNDRLSIGQEWDDNILSDFFNGSISDVRIYNYALSESEISAIYSERSQSSFEIGSLNKGLIAHYPLNGTTETKDITPYANHGVNNGAVLAEGIDGGSEGSYMFNGNSNYIQPINFVQTPMFTVSFWMKANATQLTHTNMIDNSHTSSQNWCFEYLDDTDKLKFYIKGGLVSTTGLKDNIWHHIVGTFDGSLAKFYIDSFLEASEPKTITYVPAPLSIGRWGYDGTRYFNGNLTDVRIYNRALSENEIQTLYEYGGKNIERSAGSLNKGLVLDMPLKEEAMGTEGTENLIDSIGSTIRCIKYGNGVLIDWTSDFGDTYFFFNLKDSLLLTEGDQYTLSFDCNGLPEDKIIKFAWANTASNQTTLVNGRNSLTFLVPSDIRAFFDDTLRDNTIDYLYLYNFQLEAKDHSTPFVVGTRKDTVFDNSPYKNHGEVNGAVIGEDGADFDGVDDYISIGTITPSTSDITLSMWINPNDLSGHSSNVGLASLSSTTQARIILTDDESPNTQVRWRHADGSYGTYALTSAMTSGNWHFITMVYDSLAGTLNGYLDGVLFINNTSVDLYSNFNTINIGTASAYDSMDGSISNVKIYNRALSDDEVKMLYDMGR